MNGETGDARPHGVDQRTVWTWEQRSQSTVEMYQQLFDPKGTFTDSKLLEYQNWNFTSTKDAATQTKQLRPLRRSKKRKRPWDIVPLSVQDSGPIWKRVHFLEKKLELIKSQLSREKSNRSSIKCKLGKVESDLNLQLQLINGLRKEQLIYCDLGGDIDFANAWDRFTNDVSMEIVQHQIPSQKIQIPQELPPKGNTNTNHIDIPCNDNDRCKDKYKSEKSWKKTDEKLDNTKPKVAGENLKLKEIIKIIKTTTSADKKKDSNVVKVDIVNKPMPKVVKQELPKLMKAGAATATKKVNMEIVQKRDSTDIPCNDRCKDKMEVVEKWDDIDIDIPNKDNLEIVQKLDDLDIPIPSKDKMDIMQKLDDLDIPNKDNLEIVQKLDDIIDIPCNNICKGKKSRKKKIPKKPKAKLAKLRHEQLGKTKSEVIDEKLTPKEIIEVGETNTSADKKEEDSNVVEVDSLNKPMTNVVKDDIDIPCNDNERGKHKNKSEKSRKIRPRKPKAKVRLEELAKTKSEVTDTKLTPKEIVQVVETKTSADKKEDSNVVEVDSVNKPMSPVVKHDIDILSNERCKDKNKSEKSRKKRARVPKAKLRHEELSNAKPEVIQIGNRKVTAKELIDEYRKKGNPNYGNYVEFVVTANVNQDKLTPKENVEVVETKTIADKKEDFNVEEVDFVKPMSNVVNQELAKLMKAGAPTKKVKSKEKKLQQPKNNGRNNNNCPCPCQSLLKNLGGKPKKGAEKILPNTTELINFKPVHDGFFKMRMKTCASGIIKGVNDAYTCIPSSVKNGVRSVLLSPIVAVADANQSSNTVTEEGNISTSSKSEECVNNKNDTKFTGVRASASISSLGRLVLVGRRRLPRNRS